MDAAAKMLAACDNQGALARGSGQGALARGCGQAALARRRTVRACRSAGLALEAMIAIFPRYDVMNRAISVRCENGDRDEQSFMLPSVPALAVALW
jgi:hypothetical protein